MAIVPTVSKIGDAALTSSIIDRSITELQDEQITVIAEYGLYACSALKKGVFGALANVMNYAFSGCSALEELDFHSKVYFAANGLRSATALKTLILRSNTKCTLASNMSLYDTPIFNGEGYIFVPSALVDSYKSDSKWSQYANQIHPIEGYTVTWVNADGTVLETDTGVQVGETPTYNGSTPVDSVNGYEWDGWTPAVAPVNSDVIYTATFKDAWSEVAAAIADGTYKTKYAIGDTVALDLGSEGIINMQIAAFDADTLADGSGTAAISWVGKELLATKQAWGPSTGVSWGAGGSLRSYLQNDIRALIPEKVAAMVKSVKKSHQNGSATNTEMTMDDVWVPSLYEVYEGTRKYKALFPDNESRKKVCVGTTQYSAWWMRDRVSSSGVSKLTSSGSKTSTSYTTNPEGVCLGFCTGKTPT